MCFGRLDCFYQGLHALLNRRNDLLVACPVIPERILRQRRPEARQHPVVIDDQAEILVRIDPVRACDRLHQRVRFHRLVDIKRGEALHVEARQPHRADDRDAERMLRVLEGCLDVDASAVGRLETLLHQGAMRDDIEVPFFEVGDFILGFADNDFDDRLVEPLGLPPELSSRFLQKVSALDLVCACCRFRAFRLH